MSVHWSKNCFEANPSKGTYFARHELSCDLQPTRQVVRGRERQLFYCCGTLSAGGREGLDTGEALRGGQTVRFTMARVTRGDRGIYPRFPTAWLYWEETGLDTQTSVVLRRRQWWLYKDPEGESDPSNMQLLLGPFATLRGLMTALEVAVATDTIDLSV